MIIFVRNSEFITITTVRLRSENNFKQKTTTILFPYIFNVTSVPIHTLLFRGVVRVFTTICND